MEKEDDPEYNRQLPFVLLHTHVKSFYWRMEKWKLNYVFSAYSIHQTHSSLVYLTHRTNY
jgi:hypothetical protein